MHIYPSLISSNLLNIEQTLRTLDPHCDGYHLDIMDDHFVPNLTWGPAFINAIRQATKRPLHIHLMVTNPASWIDRLKLASSDTFIFHYESIKPTEQPSLIKTIHDHGVQAGIAVKPATNIKDIFDILATTDMVLLMSVEPGFSGQQFIPETVQKITPLVHMKQQKKLNFSIGMDGGINSSNIRPLDSMNVNNVAIASGIFSHQDPIASLKNLYSCAMRKTAS